jgi:hypothetical protein
MLVFTRAMPWAFKACTLCVVLTRALSAAGATGRHEHVLVPVGFFTLASVLPSTVSCVVDRARTTAYIVQSALFLLSVHGAMVALEKWHMQEYKVALTQTCVAHMLWSQWHTLGGHKHVLIYQGAVQALAAGLAVLAWGVCALMMPRVTVEIVPLVCLMFVGEVLGVGVSFVAAIVLAVGDTVEAGFVDRLS